MFSGRSRNIDILIQIMFLPRHGGKRQLMVPRGQLMAKSDTLCEAATYFARALSGLSGRDLGLYFGGVSGAMTTIMHKRIAPEAAQNRRFKKKLEKIKEPILNI